jgi:hypothetical protein
MGSKSEEEITSKRSSHSAIPIFLCGVFLVMLDLLFVPVGTVGGSNLVPWALIMGIAIPILVSGVTVFV